MFHALSKHKASAINYAKRLSGAAHEWGIACDKYEEARWNIFAISNTIYSLRQMERDGASALLSRAMQGFKVLPEGAHVNAAAS